jgi:hypothetical protein
LPPDRGKVCSAALLLTDASIPANIDLLACYPVVITIKPVMVRTNDLEVSELDVVTIQIRR